MCVTRGWASIRTKLIAFIAIPIVAIVVTFAWYFTSRQSREDAAYADTDARVYGEQFAAELRSAVAFGDHATASEVLTPVTVDNDVVATTLFGSDGEVLYQSGAPSKWVQSARRGVLSQTGTSASLAVRDQIKRTGWVPARRRTGVGGHRGADLAG